MRKSHIVLIITILVVIVILFTHPTLKGGELYSADFKNGFDVYVEESFVRLYLNPRVETPHLMWRITDEHLKNNIFKLCKKINNYRELEGGYDILLGRVTKIEHLPQVYLDTDLYCYKIEMLNWDSFPIINPFVTFPIQAELFGKPVLNVYRIDLSLKPESENTYEFVKNYFSSDSMNSSSGFGWYSTISQEHLDEFLRLISSIDAKNAKNVESF